MRAFLKTAELALNCEPVSFDVPNISYFLKCVKRKAHINRGTASSAPGFSRGTFRPHICTGESLLKLSMPYPNRIFKITIVVFGDNISLENWCSDFGWTDNRFSDPVADFCHYIIKINNSAYYNDRVPWRN